jgi:hypothetical protein
MKGHSPMFTKTGTMDLTSWPICRYDLKYYGATTIDVMYNVAVF